MLLLCNGKLMAFVVPPCHNLLLQCCGLLVVLSWEMGCSGGVVSGRACLSGSNSSTCPLMKMRLLVPRGRND